MLIAGLHAVIILTIELIVVWFNTLLDQSVDVSSSSGDDIPESVIPPGISGPLWENRSILFNERLSQDDRAYQLVRRGFDIEEVFRLIELINSGTITKETRDRAPIRHVKTNLIVICGRTINIHFDRDSLSRTFSRPINNWHLVSSVVLSFLLPLFVSTTIPMNHKAEIWYLSLICASAIFSLLLPPPSDPYITNFNDPYISYTRAASAVGFTGVVALMQMLEPFLPERVYIKEIDFTLEISDTLTFIMKAANYLFRLYPLLVFIGMVGHPITTLHYILESVNKYVFGLSGSSSFRKSIVDFLWSGCITVAVTLFLFIGENPITIGIAMLAVTFFLQFSIADNCHTFMRKHLVTAIVASIISGSTSLLNLVIQPLALRFVLLSIVICHLVIDIVLPYITTHESYFLFYGRILSFSFITKYTRYITNFVTAPAFISFALIRAPIYQPFAAMLIVHGLRIAQTIPDLFSFSIYSVFFFFPYDLGLDASAVSLIISLIINRKLIKVTRLARVWFRFREIPSGIYSDPLTSPKEFFLSTFLSYVMCFFPNPFGAFSTPALVWSFITGAPLSFVLGRKMLLTFSPPKPNCFYDYIAQTKLDDDYKKASSDHPLEAPIYLSLAEALEENLGRMVRNGDLGLVHDDSFFLLISEDLMAIIHIIAIEANKVYFQVHGLEYVSTTLCHGGELSILQQIVQEHHTFGNFGHSTAFKFSMYELRALDVQFDMTSLSQYNIKDAVFNVLGRDCLGWELRGLVYGVLKSFSTLHDHPLPNNSHLDSVVAKFSDGHLRFIRFVADSFDLEIDENLVKRVWVLVHFIHTVIVNRNGSLNQERMLDFFDGKIQIPESLQREEQHILYCFRFSIITLLMVSVGLAPSTGNSEEIFDFMEELTASYVALPMKSEEIETIMRDGALPIISLVGDADNVNIVRLSRNPISWAVFEMEAECIRGYWSNEAKCILFFAMSSRERNSIQMDVPTLRNITNQSCSPPIGYPAYVTSILHSYNDKDF